jgi:hypothetical protein
LGLWFCSFIGNIFEKWKLFDDSFPSFIYFDTKLLSFGFLAACFFSDKHEIRGFGRLFMEEVTVLLEIFSYFFSGKIERSSNGKASLRFTCLEMIAVFCRIHIHSGFFQTLQQFKIMLIMKKFRNASHRLFANSVNRIQKFSICENVFKVTIILNSEL